jgi:hypothetical protein
VSTSIVFPPFPYHGHARVVHGHGLRLHLPEELVDEGLTPCSHVFAFVSGSQEIRTAEMRVKSGRVQSK